VFTGIAIVCVATGLGAMAFAADKPAKSGSATTMAPQDRAEARKDMIQRHLDSIASRLEIKASQQSTWQTYAAAVQALGETDAARPAAAPDADAATIARERADRATAFARKLTTIADATARLQGVLSPDQKSVLNQITRAAGHHHGEFGFGPPRMEFRMRDDRRGGDRASMDGGRTEPSAPHTDSDD
jgi:hypothetical protein